MRLCEVQMYEKISDEIIRIEKVKKLKRKILSEINVRLNKYRNMTSKIPNDKGYEICIKQSFALLKLKEYIEDKYSFMDYQCRDSSRDIVIYTISDKNLNIWLQEDYSFTINFLTKAENVDYDIFQLLNDEYFGYSFTNICENILYDKKQNKTV